MAKKKQLTEFNRTEPELIDLLPRITLFPGEDETAYEELREGFLTDLAPATPYEKALAENLVTLEWEGFRLRAIRDRSILAKFQEVAIGVFQTGVARLLPHHEQEEDAVDLANALISDDPEQRSIANSELENRGVDHLLILSEAHRYASMTNGELDGKLVEIENRRRRLREDFDRIKSARAKPVEYAEVLD